MPVSLTMSVLNPLIRDFCFKEIKLDLDYIYNQRICITYFIFKDLRSEDSTFKDIYTLLRTIDFSSFPIYYKEKEINLLKNSFFIEKINNYKKFIRHMWDNFDKKSKIPFGDFKDIFTVLDSHFIVVNVEGNFTYIGFLLDIFTNELTEKKGPTYKMVTDVKTKRVNMYYNQAIIKKGEEIYSQYSDDLGKLNLDDLLLTTGFTNNDVNIIPLRKLELRDENGNFLCYVTISRTENFGLKDYDIKIIKAVLESKGGSSDKLAVKLLKRMLRRYLNNYPTTIEQDEERLKDDKLTNNERNITKVLIEEKRSLKFYLDYLESIN